MQGATSKITQTYTNSVEKNPQPRNFNAHIEVTHGSLGSPSGVATSNTTELFLFVSKFPTSKFATQSLGKLQLHLHWWRLELMKSKSNHLESTKRHVSLDVKYIYTYQVYQTPLVANPVSPTSHGCILQLPDVRISNGVVEKAGWEAESAGQCVAPVRDPFVNRFLPKNHIYIYIM